MKKYIYLEFAAKEDKNDQDYENPVGVGVHSVTMSAGRRSDVVYGKPPQTPQQRQEQIGRLMRIAVESPPEARIRAIEMLARSGELNVAPALITALGEDDPRVVLAARDGLRRISRKFRGFGLSDQPTKAEAALAAQKWRTWYRSVSPAEN